MRVWQKMVIMAFFVFAVALTFRLWATSIEIPPSQLTFLGIPYTVNPEWFPTYQQVTNLIVLSILAFGIGSGLLLGAIEVFSLENELIELERRKE